ncbi:hypothetical protein [Streptomyces sp. NPDC048521]|uniref:hypothetical protein n=1 Tax=Streptomyces sp. NPDC048521 TaxID=3365566 RepID=UPI00371EE408
MNEAAAHGLAGAALHPDAPAGLAFVDEGGHPAGLLAARLDTRGRIVSAAVLARNASPRALTAAQRTALTGIRADGSAHTRTVPGLGAYRLTALDARGIRVLTGLPLGEVQDTLRRLARTGAVAGPPRSRSSAACARWSSGGSCARSAASPPPPARSPARRSATDRSPRCPGWRHATPLPAARPARPPAPIHRTAPATPGPARHPPPSGHAAMHRSGAGVRACRPDAVFGRCRGERGLSPRGAP